MRITSSLSKILQTALFVLLSIYFFAADAAYARGGGGGSGAGGHSTGGRVPSYSADPFEINAKMLLGLILSLVILILILLPFAFLREIYNSVHFWKKEFTDDPELIKFTQAINSKFTNRYSVRYLSEDGEIWRTVLAPPELDEQEYQNLISKSELIKQVHHLFIQYQSDWTKKDFYNMTGYVAQPFYTKQYKAFASSFGDNFDIVYRPELHEVVPLSYRQEDSKGLFRVQINAEMVNFMLSPEGFILSGTAHRRQFTEYWDIEVDPGKTCHLVDISHPIAAS